MNYLSEMEWNAKWDWEKFVALGSKAIESPKKLPIADWMIVDEGDTDAGSFNLSGASGNSGASGSDGGHGSSGKSSISVSADSSAINGIQSPNYRFRKVEDVYRNFSKSMDMKGTEICGNSPPLEVSVGSMEPLIGLKLGKRTYFENSVSGDNAKSASFPVMPTPTSNTPKKTKSYGQNAAIPCCQVDDCNLDLSMSKEYHQKHRVCASHSKCPKVIVGGLERRFCQQCSRFHSLSEFDEKKRSCRKRLSDHNSRRRKPQQESIQFNSSRLSSAFYGGRPQMNFLPNSASHIRSRGPANSTWDSTCNSKFTISTGYPLKSHRPRTKLPQDTDIHDDGTNVLLASKNSTVGVLIPGFKGVLNSSHIDAAPEFDGALSLLSTNSCESGSAPQNYSPHEKDIGITQSPMAGIPEAVPPSSSEIWQPRFQALAANNHYQEIHLSKSPYEADFYSEH